MRRFIKLILTAAAAFALIAGNAASVVCSAAEVNSHEVHSGDIVEYELHAIACPTKISALDLSVFYDPSSLEFVDGSLETPSLQNAVYNTDLPGEIKLNAVTLEGWDYNEDGVIVTAKFRVISEEAGDISLYSSMKNFIDENKTELKDSYVYDVTRVEEDSLPDNAGSNGEIAADASQKSAASSSASRSVSSNGSNISPESSSAAVSSVSDEKKSESIAVSGSLPSDIPEDKAIIFDTLDTAHGDHSDNNNTLIMIICAAIIVLIAVVFVIIFKDSDGKGRRDHSA